MAYIGNIDLSHVEARGPAGPMPAGWYQAIMVDSPEVSNKSGNGKHIAFVFQVQNAKEFTGRKLTFRVNHEHANPDVVQIGLRELKAIEIAVGFHHNDTSNWHNIPMMVQVKTVDGKDKNGNPRIYNEIVSGGFKNLNAYNAEKAQQQQMQQPASDAPGSGWLS